MLPLLYSSVFDGIRRTMSRRKNVTTAMFIAACDRGPH
jgi:hypothetical protein